MLEVVVMIGFDADTDQGIRSIWQSLADAGLPRAVEPRHRPHLTVAAFKAMNASEAEVAVRHAASAAEPVPVSWSGLGVFSEAGVVFLAPRVTEELLALHRSIYGALGEAGVARIDDHLLAPGHWVPHSSLHVGLAPSEIPVAIAASGAGLNSRSGWLAHVAAAVRPEKAERWEFALSAG